MNIGLVMDGYKPSLEMKLTPGDGVKSKLDQVSGLVDDLALVSDRLKKMDLPAKLKDFSSSIHDISQRFFTKATGFLDGITCIETILETITSVSALVNIFTTTLTPMSVIAGIYTIVKLIKSYIVKLPVVIRVAIGGLFGQQPEEEYWDTTELVAEGLGLESNMLNMAYTALIMLLPRRMRDFLDLFQKYTRVKILEDLSWVYQLADLVLHIPSFVLSLVSRVMTQIPCVAVYAHHVDVAIKKYEGLMTFLPEITTSRYVREMADLMNQIEKNRKLLCEEEFVTSLQAKIADVRSHVVLLSETQNHVPVNMVRLLTELENHWRSGYYMVQQSRPEPVAVLLYSTPGVGKTVFVQRCRKYWTGIGKNTIYDYTPTDSRSDFHDQYRNQNVWIHEDIGQRGEQDWAQYIIHIGMNPSRMDGAALDKKSTIFFRSQVILGTTNVAIHRAGLTPVRDCGWKYPHAIYRRWIVVEFKRDAVCNVFQFNVEKKIWENTGTMDCTSPQVFCDKIADLYKKKVQDHHDIVKADTNIGVANYCLGDIQAEGRTRNVALDIVDSDNCVASNHPRLQTAHFSESGFVDMIDCSETAQQQYLDAGMLINGQSSTVGIGPIHIGTKESWAEYLAKGYEDSCNLLQEKMASVWDFLTTIREVLLTNVPKEYIIGGGVIAGLSLLGMLSFMMYRMTRKPVTESQYQPFIHWAKSGKRKSAKDLYAELGARVELNFEAAPTTALAAIQKNVLRCVFSYDTCSTFGYGIMLDAHTMVTTAHLLMEGGQPREVFIRSEDEGDRERIAAFFVPIRWDLEEDLVVLRYKNPHEHVFRSLNRAMNKTPSNKALYIVATEGVLLIGEPSRVAVTSGMYKTSGHIFTMKECITHSYDGVHIAAAGLCGALVATLDGYIVGWHVAGDKRGTGYVRFWNKATKELVASGKDEEVTPLRDTTVTGAMVLDTSEYHHVNLTSGIVESAMFAQMMEEPDLCPNGKAQRLPAELGGLREVDGVMVRTYDHSRTKNLVKVDRPINVAALGFATEYMRSLIASVLPDGKSLKRLTDEEMLAGYRCEEGVMRKVNMDASAGIPLGGIVSDWVDLENCKLHPKVKSLLSQLESQARKGVKHFRDVAFKDCDKDEMRDTEKVQKPRCFAAGPLHYTLALRRWFGRLNALFMKHRHRTGIMIGINATSREWSMLWKRLCGHVNHFDGDYEMWDGGMRREVQEKLNEVMSSFCDEPTLGMTLLMHLCETTHMGMDFSYLTTHSVPSGHGLTALYNSLINKMYVAYAWYILVGSSLNLSITGLIVSLDQSVYAPVYGDDIVCSVSSGIAQRFNAMTYGMVMRDLGLGFTSASKKNHETPFVALRDITFLKRSFYANRRIGDIVGPLAIRVLSGSAGFVHDATRDQEITQQKLNSIQRELFLHSPEVYSTKWSALTRCYQRAFGVPYYGLTEIEMRALYDSGELRSDLFEAYAENGHLDVGPPRLISKRKGKNLCRW